MIKMQKRRAIALCLSALMLIGVLAGCAQKAPEEETKAPEEETAVTPTPAVTEPESEIESSEDLSAAMNTLISDEEFPLAAAAIGIIKDGEIIFADTVGNKYIDNENPENNIAANADTKYRIASISKLNTAIAVWQLIEQGKFSPEDDAAELLGFELRNPNFPDTPITVGMLLSHTSSIREGGDNSGTYNIPFGHHIKEFFDEESECYCEGAWAPEGEAPGEFFSYCNFNYCLLATIVERVSGERFDQYMKNHVYDPMGLTCGYNVAEMAPDVQETVGTLYRKFNEDGEYDPVNGKWEAQVDDYTDGYPEADMYDDYEIGTNGSLFGPMGSLRISVKELCAIMQMYTNGGSYNDVQILKPETVERMFTPYWSYDAEKENGDTYYDLMLCYGMGPHIFTNKGGDRLVENQDLPFVGHTAEAYGLLGGMGFDLEKGNGIVYIVAGMGNDMDEYYGDYSSFYKWEEQLMTMAGELADFDY